MTIVALIFEQMSLRFFEGNETSIFVKVAFRQAKRGI